MDILTPNITSVEVNKAWRGMKRVRHETSYFTSNLIKDAGYFALNNLTGLLTKCLKVKAVVS